MGEKGFLVPYCIDAYIFYKFWGEGGEGGAPSFSSALIFNISKIIPEQKKTEEIQ